MTTLLDLRTRARERADMVGSQFISDSALSTIVNQGLMELYDLVVSAYEDYFTISSTFTVNSGASSYTLPANFYKLRALDFQVGPNNYAQCREFAFNERNRTQTDVAWISYNTPARQYRIMGNDLLLRPSTNAQGNYLLWYVPAPAALVADADTIPTALSKSGWDEYIVLFTAERMLSKEESSITDVRNERIELANRITNLAANRQADQSSQIQDVTIGFAHRIGADYEY